MLEPLIVARLNSEPFTRLWVLVTQLQVTRWRRGNSAEGGRADMRAEWRGAVLAPAQAPADHRHLTSLPCVLCTAKSQCQKKVMSQPLHSTQPRRIQPSSHK